MSIDTELARVKGAKANLKSWVEENGVVVPDGTLIDGLVELAKTVETGGGGGDTQIDGLIDRSITEILNSRVTKIGNYAFAECMSLRTADFPAATTIGQYAFQNCTKLTTVDFPAVTTIKNYALSGCNTLTTVDFPLAIDLGSNIFSSCSSLTTADFPAATSISNFMFQSCTKLTTVDFPAVTRIGQNAFQNCTKLTTVDFPAVNTIMQYAFSYCSALTALILRNPNAVCTLSNTNAFTSTPIASGTGYIYVPSALVDSYKAATNWSTYANQIRAIEDYPDITGGAA